FARLHVTRVAAHLDAQRGLAEAAIVGVHKPKRVRAGRAVTVRMVVRLFRGPLRTIRFRLHIPKLRVPRGQHRTLVVKLHGPPPPPGPQSMSDSLSAALGLSLSGS